jgi:hypothetical protein
MDNNTVISDPKTLFLFCSLSQLRRIASFFPVPCRGLVVSVPGAKDKYSQTCSVLEDLTSESNTWRLMGKVNVIRSNINNCLKKNRLPTFKGTGLNRKFEILLMTIIQLIYCRHYFSCSMTNWWRHSGHLLTCRLRHQVSHSFKCGVAQWSSRRPARVRFPQCISHSVQDYSCQ